MKEKELQMSRENMVRAYLDAMSRSNLDEVLVYFEADALVRSPTYGKASAKPFYEKLFADTKEAQVDLYCLYSGIDHPERIAAHFGYTWVKRDGSRVETDLVDLFTFRAGSDRIAQLSIIFDTGVRAQKTH